MVVLTSLILALVFIINSMSIRILFVLLMFWPTLGHTVTTVYLKPAEALKIIFKDSKEVVSEKKTLSPKQKGIVEKQSGTHLTKSVFTFFIAKSGHQIDGYALIDHEIGKTEPITFLTALTPSGKIKAVEILVYRESHGSEIVQKHFRNQFKGKKAQNPIKVGQDIKNISGATLSARAIARGVKKALALWQIFYYQD